MTNPPKELVVTHAWTGCNHLALRGYGGVYAAMVSYKRRRKAYVKPC